jgi:hypothetical protein
MEPRRLSVLDELMGGARPAWHREAACRGLDTSAFFVDRGRRSDPVAAICEACPVRQPCRSHADALPEKFGVWGGATAWLRMRERSSAHREELARAEETRRREEAEAEAERQRQAAERERQSAKAEAERERKARRAERNRARGPERYRQLREKLAADPERAERYRLQVNRDCRAYYERRKARLASDPEAAELFRKRRRETNRRSDERRRARLNAEREAT